MSLWKPLANVRINKSFRKSDKKQQTLQYRALRQTSGPSTIFRYDNPLTDLWHVVLRGVGQFFFNSMLSLLLSLIMIAIIEFYCLLLPMYRGCVFLYKENITSLHWISRMLPSNQLYKANRPIHYWHHVTFIMADFGKDQVEWKQCFASYWTFSKSRRRYSEKMNWVTR